MTLRHAQIVVREVVEAAMETTASLIRERGHVLDVRLPPEPVLVKRSAGAGRGTRVVVTLPLASPLGVGPGIAEIRPTVAHRVLVVQALEALLRIAGHEVMGAGDGAQALVQAKAFRPTVVLVDLGLPDVSGYDVARSLRADSTRAGLHLVAVTGWAQEEDRQRSAEAGFDRHLVKPVEPAALHRLRIR